MPELRCAACHSELQTTTDGEVAPCPRCAEPRETPYTPVPTDHRPRRGGAQVSVALAVLAASLTTAMFYVVGPMTVLRDTRLYGVFCSHGWVPYVSMFLFDVALWMLLLKLPAIRTEYKAFALDLLPTDAAASIDRSLSGKVLDRIARLSPRCQRMLLVSRIRQALLRLNQLGTSEHLDELLRHRADADVAAVDSSYATPKFIIWAIPVLGFVGTVLGISNGVAAFSTLIQNASDLEGLRESLKGVTYGLGQAFETTMVALCMSLVLMLIMSFLQKREDQLLDAVDEYCTEHLLHRVEDQRQAGDHKRELLEVLAKISQHLDRANAPLDHHDHVVPEMNRSTGVTARS